MKYETHITVEDFPSILESGLFADFCVKELSSKANLIELKGGKHPLQLMLAKKEEFSSDLDALQWGHRLAEEVRKAGWDVKRIKVEAPLGEGRVEYFEAHYKLTVFPEPTIEDLDKFCKKNNEFLRSKNLFQKNVHYLSLRDYTFDFFNALKQFETGHERIASATLPLESFHYERVLLDTNPAIDEGWAEYFLDDAHRLKPGN